MNTKTITNADIADLKVASLPSRPTAPTSFGGRGYTATQMKEAFDRLPLHIIEKFNSLLTDLTSPPTDQGSFSASLPTGISEGHTLSRLFADITNGNLASYLKVLDTTLTAYLTALKARVDELRGDVDALPDHSVFVTYSSLAATVDTLVSKSALSEELTLYVKWAELLKLLEGYLTKDTLEEKADEIFATRLPDYVKRTELEETLSLYAHWNDINAVHEYYVLKDSFNEALGNVAELLKKLNDGGEE